VGADLRRGHHCLRFEGPLRQISQESGTEKRRVHGDDEVKLGPGVGKRGMNPAQWAASRKNVGDRWTEAAVEPGRAQDEDLTGNGAQRGQRRFKPRYSADRPTVVS